MPGLDWHRLCRSCLSSCKARSRSSRLRMSQRKRSLIVVRSWASPQRSPWRRTASRLARITQLARSVEMVLGDSKASCQSVDLNVWLLFGRWSRGPRQFQLLKSKMKLPRNGPYHQADFLLKNVVRSTITGNQLIYKQVLVKPAQHQKRGWVLG